MFDSLVHFPFTVSVVSKLEEEYLYAIQKSDAYLRQFALLTHISTQAAINFVKRHLAESEIR